MWCTCALILFYWISISFILFLFDPITRTNCLRGHPSIEIYDQLLQSNLIKSTKCVYSYFYSLQMQSMTSIDDYYSIGHTPISFWFHIEILSVDYVIWCEQRNFNADVSLGQSHEMNDCLVNTCLVCLCTEQCIMYEPRTIFTANILASHADLRIIM